MYNRYMERHFYQKGGVGAGFIFTGVIFFILGYFYFHPTNFAPYSQSNMQAGQFCRPYVEADGSIKPNAPTIMAPSYDGGVVRRGQPFPKLNPDDMQPYRLVKSTVPVNAAYFGHGAFSKQNLKNKTPNEIHCETYKDNGNTHSHFCQWIHEPLQIPNSLSNAAQYAVLYPAPYSDGNSTDRYIGATDPFSSELSDDEVFRYGTYHILFLLQLDKNEEPIRFSEHFYSVDIYQQVDENDLSKPLEKFPESVMRCIDDQPEESAFKLGPVIEKSPDKAQEQLGWFYPEQSIVVEAWYKPACKPAINLYPTEDTVVNVKVGIRNGFLTYTDPVYPGEKGWSVLAKPTGELQYLGSTLSDSTGKQNYPIGIFPYLYYEAKIQDSATPKPDQGYVIRYDNLAGFYDELLPKLGLNQKETKEFKDYWVKALPKSPYYFIGLIPQEQLDTNEPLTITPKEDTMIRVRLYFEALEKPQRFTAPKLQSPTRNGFTVVDWGGMVKRDKDHPFTCLQ